MKGVRIYSEKKIMRTFKRFMARALAVSLCTAAVSSVYADTELASDQPVSATVADTAKESDKVTEVNSEEAKEVASGVITDDDNYSDNPDYRISLSDIYMEYSIKDDNTAYVTGNISREDRLQFNDKVQNEYLTNTLEKFHDDIDKFKVTRVVVQNGNIPLEKIDNSVISECTIIEIPNNFLKDCKSVVSVSLPDSIQIIGKNSFENCSSLNEINFPENLKEICSYAFANTGISKVEFGSNLNLIWGSAFENCTDLTEISTPDSIQGIGDSAFSGCTNLEKAVIGKGVTLYSESFGVNIFKGCKKLKELTIPCIDEKINDTFFDNTEDNNIEMVTITEGKEVPSGIFENCTKLKSVSMSDSITKIGDSVFYGCTSLEKISLPKSLTSIGNYAFSNSGISKVEFNSELSEILASAFENCANLTEIIIPNKVGAIYDSAFAGCKNLEKVSLYNCDFTGFGVDIFKGCTKLKKLTVPNVYINYNFFKDPEDNNVEEITIIDSKYICEEYFKDCTKLKSVTISDSVIGIGDYAFSGCSSLEEVTCSKNLNYVSSYALEKCDNLKTIYYEGTEEDAKIIKVDPSNDNILNAKIVFGSKNEKIYGDLDGNGYADLTDLTLLSIYLMDKEATSNIKNIDMADVDGNGETDIADLARFKQYISKDVTVPKLGPVK